MVSWCEAWNGIISIKLPAWLKMRNLRILMIKEDSIIFMRLM